MEILSLSYHINNGIRELIEQYHLYPITAIKKFTKKEIEQLIGRDVILSSDIYKNYELLSQLQINRQRRHSIISNINFVYNK